MRVGADLAERGQALVFDVLQYGEPVRAFALRFDGQVVGLPEPLRCTCPTEMDWQPGEFLDGDRRFILCSIHGAAYEPIGGRCVGGPCGRGRLTAVEVEERDGQVYWYPSRDIRPLPFDDAGPEGEQHMNPQDEGVRGRASSRRRAGRGAVAPQLSRPPGKRARSWRARDCCATGAASAAGASSSAWRGWRWCWPSPGGCWRSAWRCPRRAARTPRWSKCAARSTPTSEASAEALVAALNSAFEDSGAQAVVLRINSPGGSPVQAGIVNDEIRRLKALHKKKVYAVVEEICASGAYYIAVAADEIYVDKASLVGSIGVLMDGFGFIGPMEKLGVERRLLTAGENKGMLDPFSPQDEQAARLCQGDDRPDPPAVHQGGARRPRHSG